MNKDSIKKRIKEVITQIAPDKKPKIFFVHIPKTGGTSLFYSLKKLYFRNYYVDNVAISATAAKNLYETSNKEKNEYKFRQHLIAYEMGKGTKYIVAHVPFNSNLWQAYNAYKFITLLREPVSRYISEYFYNVYKKADNHGKIDMDLSSFIKTNRGKEQGQIYVNYIGDSFLDNSSISERLKIAKNNLAKFHLVGFLENIDDFVLGFQKEFGLKVKFMHKNQNPAPNQEVDEKIIEQIKKICEPDIEFYEYAKEKILRKQ